jgi:branched-chain amino acid transport system ATP-binding protein
LSNFSEYTQLPAHLIRAPSSSDQLLRWYDMKMVADLAHRIHVLDYGRTLSSGPADEVLNDPKVIGASLGRA